MANINKENRKNSAVIHDEYMRHNFKEETQSSINGSTVYRDCFDFSKETKIKVVDLTTEKAVRQYSDGIVPCVLNFASYTHPGGGFIGGAIAQEEAICHYSNLYNVLTNFQHEYDINRKTTNNGLYTDFAIYSPNVCFIYDEGTEKQHVCRANVITCAAPNRGWAEVELGYDRAKDAANKIIKRRCHIILEIAKQHKEKTLILGAFGCGVFGNSPYVVAKSFKELIENCTYDFDEVIFAIPDKYSDNYVAFKEVFEDNI